MATPVAAAPSGSSMPSASASSKVPPSHHCAECSRVCRIRDRILHAIDAHLNDHVRKKTTQQQQPAADASGVAATTLTTPAAVPTAPVDAAPATTPAKVAEPVVAADATPETETNADTPPPVPADAPPPTDTAGDEASIVAPAAIEIPPAVVVAPSTFLTLPSLVELLRPLADVRVLLCAACPADFMGVLASEIKEAVFAYLLSVREDDDAMRAWSRRTISRPLVQVEMLLTAAKVDAVEIKRIFEMFELDWAWAYARSRTLPLDRRISAINDIKDVIDFVEKKEEWFRKKGSQGSTAGSMLGYVNAAVTSSLSGQPDQPPAYTRIWMNSDALCKFILQNNMLEELLEPSTTHVELIRRCQPLMRLLSMQSAAAPAGKAGSASSSSSSSSLLTTAHLDLLWQLSCMGKHESIEHLVYDIVARLSPSLSLPLLNHLWTRICERSFAAYDTIYLTLIHSFTLNTLRADSPVAQAVAASKGVDREQQQTYGIDLLWTLLQSAQISARGGTDSASSSPVSPPKSPSPAPAAASSSVSPEVLLRARDLLLDLLGLEACAVHRSRFLDRCVLNLKNGVLVAQSLHILLKLIQMYPLKSSGWFGGSSSQTQPAVIEALDEKYDLLNLVLQEMAAFQTRINQAEQAKGAQSGSPAHAAAAAALTAKQQLEQLEVREEFLVSILTHSALTLSKAQVDLVWNSLVVQASQSAARDSVYAWLIDAGDQDSTMMTDDVRAHLFNTKLLTLHPASLTPLGFKLLLRYFLRVHVKAGVMKMSDAESNVANTPSSGAAQAGKALKGEFGRILAKHRGRPLAGAVASKSAVSAQPKGLPMLERSLSELGSESVEYSVLSDEEQLAASPVFEANVLSNTQRMCSSLSVHQYSELRGIPLLWDIILRNPRARVARQAIVLLNTLHQNLSSKVKNVAAPIGAGNPPTAASSASSAPSDSQSQIRDAHLKACLSHLSKALAETSAPSNGHSRAGSAKDLVDVSTKAANDAQSKKKISRCIFVLKTFLNGFADKSARKKASADDTAAADTFVLHIHPNREYRTEPFDVSVSRHDTIGDLRSAVFTKLSASNPTVSLKTMCLVWENKKLLTNHFGLGNVGFKTHDHVIIKRNSDLFTAYSPHAMVYSSPAATVFSSMLFDCLEEPWVEMQGREKYMSAQTLMARTVVNEDAERSWARKKPASTASGAQGEDASLSSIATDPASFDRLFALLSSNSPIAPSVFEILMMLPSSARGLGGLLDPRSFNPERWESILDSKAMYRLLYSLQSIEEILTFRTPAIVRASPAMQALDLKSFDLLVWAQGFIAKGGVNYLAALATNKAWQQSHNGGGPPPSSALATISKRNGGAASSAASVVVPRAVFHEVLQSLFSILYTFFCFDVTFPGGQQRATRGQTHLAEGCWTRLPNWESWLKLLVNEAIIPAMLNSQINLSPPAALPGEISGARDDNSTSMILSAMRLLVGCMYAVPSLLPSVFYDQETLTPRLLTVLLLECPSSAARTQAAQGFLSVFKLSLRHASNPEQKAFWLRILVQLLRSPALKLHAQQSQEFFLLFSSYIDVLFSPVHAATQAASRSLIQSLSLFPTLWSLLQEHVSTELYENYLQVDEGLFGLLQLLRCLVTNRLTEVERPAADPSSMVAAAAGSDSSPSLTTLLSYVYHECLFNTPADDALQGCKCKTHSTRVQAFALLLELSAAHEPCYAELLDMLCADGMWQIVRPDTQWTYDPTHFEKGLVPAPVGLKNQGATCYMNSFVQCLFSTKAFRHAIMALRTDIDDEAAVALSNAHSNDAVASSRAENSASIVHQLQLLFGHLAWSQKSFFDTLHFCSNFRDYSGLPINIGEQKDVNEFAALLFDQLENEVNQLTKPKGGSSKGGSGGKPDEEQKSGDAVSAAPAQLNPLIQRNLVSQRIIDRTFKGALVHQILALNPDECPHTTAREEAFSMLSLTVVNKRNVDQSLHGFIEGDRLDGENKFMCQGCSKKVGALKRCCLHDTKLPQVLILHFKRFEFNFDSMRKEKVNDLFEFPYKQGEFLNVEKFTQSGIARAEAIAKGLEPPPVTPRPEGFYEYSLVAVLIHGGSAEGGHYITICKGEVPSAANAAAASSGAAATGSEGISGLASDSSSSDQSSFFEFNDSVVRPFNPADIPAACFGGTELVEQFDKTLGRTVMKEVPQVKNAYMAIFERKWKPTDEEDAQAEAANEAAAPSASVVAASGDNKPDVAASSLEDRPQTSEDSDDAAVTSADDIMLETDEKADGESKPLPASASSSALPTRSLGSASSSSASSSAVVPVAAPSSGAIYSFDRSRADLSHFPRAVIDAVWSDNLAFLHDKFAMDANTNWFLWTIVQLHLPGKNAMIPLSATTPPAPDTSAWAAKASVPLAKLSVLFVLKLLVRNADNASFPQWIDLLYQIFDWDAAARDWFLDFLVQGSNLEAPAEKAAENAASSYLSPNAGSALLVQLLFESPIQIVREAMCDLVVFVISAAREDKHERALYFADWKTPAAPAASAAAASHDGAASSSSAEPKPVTADPAKEPAVTAADAAAEPAPLAVPVESSAVSAAAASAMEPRASTPSPTPASSSPLPRLPSSRIIRVFQYLLDWVPRVRKYHRSYKEYWRLLFLLARLGVEERKWFVGAGAIQLILNGFYLDLEPLTGFNVSHPYGTDPPRRKHVPMPFWMLQLLSLLVRSCETDALKGIGPPAPSQTARTLIPLSSTERDLLLAGWVFHPPATHPPTRHLLPWLLLDRGNPSAVVGLVVHWCWERVDYSSRMFDLLLRLTVSEITTIADAGEYKLLFAVYTSVLCIADSHSSQTARVEYGLTELMGLLRKVVVRNKIGDQKLLFHAMPLLLSASFKSPVVALWMDTHQRDHAGWLADYKRTRVEIAQQMPQQNYRRA